MTVKYKSFFQVVLAIFVLFGLLYSPTLVHAQNACNGGPSYCTAGPCSCTDAGQDDSCICSAQDCRSCGAGWLPCECEISVSTGHMVCTEIACTNNPQTTSCPSYIDPCCNTSGCTSTGGGGGGGGGGEEEEDTGTHSECIGNACTTVSGTGANQCNSNADCTVSYSVSGTVFLGSATWNGTNCVSGTGSAIQPGASSYVRINSTGTSPITAGGTYTTATAGGVNIFTLVPSDPLYIASCPPAGIYNRTISGNVTGLNYYVTTQQISWWQTRGGDVGANNGSIATNIPSTCTGACKPYVTLYDSALNADSSGLVWMSSLIGSFGNAGNDVSEGRDYKLPQTSVRTLTKREGYEYFYRLFEMGLNPAEDAVLADNEANMAKPDSTFDPPTNGRAYFVRAGDGSGSVTIDTAWTTNPGESMVVFVDGDLIVNQPINVAVGDFLAFVVSGDITFNLGNAVPSLVTPNVQGVFVADGQIITSSDTEQFVGQGMFIGWGGVDMNRDFGDNTSNTNPSEFFSYRPDFVTNAPARMKRPVIRWEEVAP